MLSIESARWKSFVDRFSREHDGWSASLHLRQSDGSSETAVDDRPFRGATVESHERAVSVILTFGDDPDEHLTHIARRPTDIALLSPNEGECSLVIGLDDGSGCVLELTSPFNPD
jgi:Family of unknown function (DUF5335)